MDGTDPTGSSLEAIEFLASSENRVVLLDTLAEGPMDRHEIADATGISRPTLSRILEDFETRGWITRDGRRYEPTQLGAFVAEEFTRLLERMVVDSTLKDVVRWFPDEAYGFDLARLAAADVVRPRKSDALAPTNHIVRRLEAARRVRVLTYTVLPDAFRACWQETVHGEQELEVVFDPEAVATLATDRRSIEQAREMIESGRVSFYRYGDEVPYIVIIPDDEAVLLCLSGGSGEPRAVVDTDDEAVRAWAESTFESYREESTPLDPSLFTA